MSKRKKARRGSAPARKPTTLEMADKVIRSIALRENSTPEQVRKQIRLAMLSGLLNEKPEVRKAWEQIPCVGEVPTPDEVIAYYAERLREK